MRVLRILTLNRHKREDFAAMHRLAYVLDCGPRLRTTHAEARVHHASRRRGYGANLADLSRRAAYFVDKIFKGAKPADLPVQQPTKFEMVINLTTAKVLGLPIPSTLIARADEVIE
jgi:putative ABC transport system substrate-binding protein